MDSGGSFSRNDMVLPVANKHIYDKAQSVLTILNTKEIKWVWTSDAIRDTTKHETERKKVINALKEESLKRGRAEMRALSNV